MNLREWLLTAAAAALYAALTLFLAPLSYGPVQARLSECMVLLAYYNKKWIPGLTAGCLLANLAKFQRRDARGLRGLQNDTIPRCERRGDLPREHEQRKIPRNHLPGDAERL